MDVGWWQYGALWIWSNNIDQCKVEVNICFIICQMFMVQAHWSMDTYLARFSLIIYYHTLFSSLEHGATIMMLYCDVRYHGNTRVTFRPNNSTIWYHNSTIWCHNSSTIATVNIGKYWLVNMLYWVNMQHYWQSCDHESTNQLWVFTFNI